MAQYKLYNDEDGHTYLIPYGIYSLFCDKVDKFEEAEDLEGLADYLENFERLEGKPYVVFLEEDLEKNYK